MAVDVKPDLDVAGVLDKALSGERISDADARVLLESRELVRIGRAAHELRNRRTEPGRVTFIVDRNLNYTNICCRMGRASPSRATTASPRSTSRIRRTRIRRWC